MTEAEWLACANPTPMLNYLEGRSSDRKDRLFVCAGCRLLWPWMHDPRSRRAIETSERFADGAADAEELDWFRREAWQAVQDVGLTSPLASIPEAAATAARLLTQQMQPALWASVAIAAAVLRRSQKPRLCELIREVFGNPFRPLEVPAAWLAWQDGTVPRLAQVIYDNRSFADLPLLADALEEAGCTDAALLAHCRTPAEHVLGCWVLDALLGKQ
jgi:hypothetical protein